MPTQPPIAYTCIVSGFNLPALEACINLKPEHILLIASDKFTDPAARLENLLRHKLPDCHIEVLSRSSTGEKLDGDDIMANIAWLQNHLRPRLEQFKQQGKKNVANITGGTKAMTMALDNCYPWHRLDYQPVNGSMQSIQFQRSGQTSGYQPIDAFSSQWANAQPLDIAQLHNTEAHLEPGNPLLKNAHSLPLAQRIWQAQHNGDASLQLLFDGFERIWVHERDQHQKAKVSLRWQDFFPQNTNAAKFDAAVGEWLKQLQQLQAEQSPLQWDDNTITLPGNAPKKHAKNLRNWISGDWLEQLAYHWLIDNGIAPEAVACNIVGSAQPNNSNSQREADLLVHHRNVTSLIEVKAGIPPGQQPKDLENQLSSLDRRFGKTSKALLLGPQLLRVLRKQKKSEAFWYRCWANEVTLLLDDKHLLNFVRNQKVWEKLDEIPEPFRHNP